MGMYNPPHLGEMLKEFMSDSITVTQLAADLCITRTALSKIINGRTAISTAMAEKLAIAFPFTTPKMWLIWQNDYDLAVAYPEPDHSFQGRALPLVQG